MNSFDPSSRQYRIRRTLLIIALFCTTSASAWAGAAWACTHRWDESTTASFDRDAAATMLTIASNVRGEQAAPTNPNGKGAAPAQGRGTTPGNPPAGDKASPPSAEGTPHSSEASPPTTDESPRAGEGSSPTAEASPPTAAIPSPQENLKTVISDVYPSVVYISTYDASGVGISQGSGVVVAPNTIVTNEHVVRSASRVIVIDSAGTVRTSKGTLAVDPDHDLALLECETGATPVALADADMISVGDSVVAIGNPRGLQGTVSTGIISGPLRTFGGVNYWQTTAPTSPGSSGGGLFAMDSSLIGITTLIFKDSQNLNLVVPAEYVKDLMARPLALKEYPSAQSSEPRSGTKPVARYFEGK